MILPATIHSTHVNSSTVNSSTIIGNTVSPVSLNASSPDLAAVSSIPTLNVSLSSTKGAQISAATTIPPIYSKPIVYSSNENQLTLSKGGDLRHPQVENARLSELPINTMQDESVVAEESEADKGEFKDKSSSVDIELTEAELEMVEELKARDLEVRAHEQAHKAVGGQYAGAISYSYQTGPDGKRYAIGGEVPIDVSPVAGKPQATITKMAVVSKAATAPAQPSAQDQIVAAKAKQIMSEAQAELAQTKYSEQAGSQEKQSSQNNFSVRDSSTSSLQSSLETFQVIAKDDMEASHIIDSIV